MYSRKTTMTRLINWMIERTVSLVSALRALPMGPMQTMLTSPLGRAGIRPLPALAAQPLADAQERRGAMRISKQFKLSLMAALVGLAIHSGLVAAEPPVGASARGGLIGQAVRRHKAGADPEVIVREITNSCNFHFTKDADRNRCVELAFLSICPKSDPFFKECKKISDKLNNLGYPNIPAWACATKETGDQLCLVSPTRVSSGDLLPISIDIGDLSGGAVENVVVTVQVSTAFGAELSQPYRDPENPGDFDLTWTGGPYDWVGTASLESISGTVSAQPVFAIGNVPAGDSVTITGHVDYTDDGFFESMEVLSSAGVSSETEVTPEELANEREVQIEQSDLDLSLSSNAENDLDSGDIDNGEANGGEVSLVVEQPGEPEDCHVHNSIYDSCPIEGVPLN